LVDQLEAGETGVEKYEIASNEDPGITTVAELVRDISAEEIDFEPEIELLENPRDETLVSEFAVDTSKVRSDLQWEPEHKVRQSIRGLLQ